MGGRSLLKTESTPEHSYQSFLEYVEKWTPEIRIHNVRARPGLKERELDVFYTEEGSRKEKELVWSGDGLQIWLQILFHLFRCRRDPVVVLDEPDVYLHADLQRRLVRVLEDHVAQTILATHSPEVLGEAPGDSILWVDRARRNAVRAPDGKALEQLSGALGSQFNMRLARALRANVALFFEGDDYRILRRIAASIGANRIADEEGVAIVPIGGYSNWERVEPFVWLMEKLLEKSVAGFVLLDRDFRPDQLSREVEQKLAAVGYQAHVWRRKELESYLLVPSLIARVSGAAVEWVETAIRDCVEPMKSFTFARLHEEASRYSVSASSSPVSVTEALHGEFERQWAIPEERLRLCHAKEVMKGLNAKLSLEGYRTVSALGLAKAIRPDEVDAEMREVLMRIEALATPMPRR